MNAGGRPKGAGRARVGAAGGDQSRLPSPDDEQRELEREETVGAPLRLLLADLGAVVAAASDDNRDVARGTGVHSSAEAHRRRRGRRALPVRYQVAAEVERVELEPEPA